jgi:methyl-accepting chemotaxis protein
MLQSFKMSWKALGKDAEAQLQKLYITDNPNPTGQKENLDAAEDDSPYSSIHGRFHPSVRNFLRERDYYDIFLFDTKGNLVYAVFKELDYATNLATGKYKDTGLGAVFRGARDNPKQGFIIFDDFKPYAPSHGAAASFIATPILRPDGTLLGVLAFQMPINRINAVMQQKAGMGESGETYIVGGDFLMRSDSRFFKDSTILKTKVETETVKLAIAGKNGVKVVPDYRGIPVYSAYESIDFHGTRWAILAEIDEVEVLAPVVQMRNAMLIASAVLLAVVTAIGIFFAMGITRPIARMTDAMSALADGDKTVEIPATDRSDEIGDMASAVVVFKDNMIKNEELAVEQKRMEEEQKKAEEKRLATEKAAEDAARDREAKAADDKAKRAAALDELNAAFDKKASAALESVSAAATEMQASAESMSSTAEETNTQSTAVAAAAEQASANVQTVATAAEELSASINEISRQVAQSSEI